MRIMVRSVRAERRPLRGGARAPLSRNTVNPLTTHRLSMRDRTVERFVRNRCAVPPFRTLHAISS
jgi:hypothetical protein